jgi:Flp pilus assembly protein TadG
MRTKTIISFKQDSKGAALVEFTFLLPLLITLSLGIYEVTNYIMLTTKLNEIAGQVGNWVSAQTSTATITDCLIGANLMGTDYNFSAKGGVVVSGLQQVGTTTAQKLVWQQASLGASSTITSSGGNASAPFSMALASNLIVVEVSYNYQPIFTYFLSIFPAIKLLKVFQSVPRGTGSFNPLPAT